MTESAQPEPRSAEELRKMLQAAAQLLLASPALAKEAQQPLADLVDELGKLLETTPVPTAELQHLSESVAHLVHVMREPRHLGLLASARERLDRAIVAAEIDAPVAVGLSRRLLITLANVGI